MGGLDLSKVAIAWIYSRVRLIKRAVQRVSSKALIRFYRSAVDVISNARGAGWVWDARALGKLLDAIVQRGTNNSLDVNSDPVAWAEFNNAPFVKPLSYLGIVASFPPRQLMRRVSGLTNARDFATHGKDIFLALSVASPKRLADFDNILDYGVGVGRLARMFKGFRGHYTGADIDHELLAWTTKKLPWVMPMMTMPRTELPSSAGAFDCVISVSVFTHMTEVDSIFSLRSLHRVTKPGAILLLTVHGERALERAETEKRIFNMLAVPRTEIKQARRLMDIYGFKFIRQNGHLTSEVYDYGISFTGESYIRSVWAEYFAVENVVSGGIHDFQDVVVLRRA
jgi:SAM-dependent methyltransferase